MRGGISESAVIGKGSVIPSCCCIRDRVQIGEGCRLHTGVFIDYDVRIGDRVLLMPYVTVWTGVSIEDDVFVGPGATFTNDKNPRAWRQHRGDNTTIVHKGVSIGANATILTRIVLGEYCMVGAGAVVTKSVPSNTVVVGNPAKFAGWVCKCGELYKRELLTDGLDSLTEQHIEQAGGAAKLPIGYFICIHCGKRTNIYHD